MDKRRRLIRDELIGLPVTICRCTDPTWLNKSGVIVDETKNTFLIEVNGTIKRIAKNIATFEFQVNEEKIRIDGKDIMYRPEDRIKKAR